LSKFGSIERLNLSRNNPQIVSCLVVNHKFVVPVVNQSAGRKGCNLPKHVSCRKLFVGFIGDLYRKKPKNKNSGYPQNDTCNNEPAFRKSIHWLLVFKHNKLTAEYNQYRKNTAENIPDKGFEKTSKRKSFSIKQEQVMNQNSDYSIL